MPIRLKLEPSNAQKNKNEHKKAIIANEIMKIRA